MPNKITYDAHRIITFGDVLELYRTMIHSGCPRLNHFSLYAVNYVKGIDLLTDPLNPNRLCAEQSDLIRANNNSDYSRILSEIMRNQSSGDIFIRHATNAALNSANSIPLEDIADLPLDEFIASKIPHHIYLSGLRFPKYKIRLPFVKSMNIKAERSENGDYIIEVEADSEQEAELLKKVFDEIVSQDEQHRRQRPLPFEVNAPRLI